MRTAAIWRSHGLGDAAMDEKPAGDGEGRLLSAVRDPTPMIATRIEENRAHPPGSSEYALTPCGRPDCTGLKVPHRWGAGANLIRQRAQPNGCAQDTEPSCRG